MIISNIYIYICSYVNVCTYEYVIQSPQTKISDYVLGLLIDWVGCRFVLFNTPMRYQYHFPIYIYIYISVTIEPEKKNVMERN